MVFGFVIGFGMVWGTILSFLVAFPEVQYLVFEVKSAGGELAEFPCGSELTEF